ncbi:MAG: glycosyltransferase family 2 protein [Acidobacteria bacterium]|nr:glycosyltransferase family 2 protein [Acidobacteriota bacterium]
MHKVSIVMPVRNEAGVLRNSLTRARAALGTQGEIVVIDNDSTDESFVIAAELADVAIRMSGTVGACRVAGVELSSGDLIFLLDADQVLCEGTISSAVKALDESDVRAVVIPEHPLMIGNTNFMKLLSAERRLSEISGNAIPRLILREDFLRTGAEIGGRVFAEDWPLTRLPGKIALSSVPILHAEPQSLYELLGKYVDYGRRSARIGSNPPSTFGTWKRIRMFGRAASTFDRASWVWFAPVIVLKVLKLVGLLTGYALEKSRNFVIDLKSANRIT